MNLLLINVEWDEVFNRICEVFTRFSDKPRQTCATAKRIIENMNIVCPFNHNVIPMADNEN